MTLIQRARPEEAGALTEIAVAAKQHWGYPERWMQMWAYSLTIEPGYIRDHAVFWAGEAGAVLGFYALAGQGEEVELEHLWVRPEAMGQGVGRALFEHACAQAGQAGARRLTIQADPHAEGFYARMGAQRVGYYEYMLDGELRQLPKMVKGLGGAGSG